FSVRIFAEGMIANCEQVGKIIRNVTSKDPGLISNYEDLWRFTLVNYNAGSGCLSNAIQLAYRQFGYLNWENVSSRLEPGCIGAIEYVDDITFIASGVEPTPTSWVQFATPDSAQLTAMATMATMQPTFVFPTITPLPTTSQGTPQPTATLGNYPGGPTPTPGDSGYPEWPTPGPTDSIYP
ncbi:MAG: hypothetical protein FD166_3719, partial [Bacteroidetes bacterium]